ncbi:hypothetical protein [Synechocystis sp. PCC 7509]|uniref:hypothetical protein n=1 Tax=Synechocystis sp. PCC 7509 TaxID=927677 RepID=UPI0002ABFC0B|nr:hypothetical protein [Synechocystis sp. PCC 7509]
MEPLKDAIDGFVDAIAEIDRSGKKSLQAGTGAAVTVGSAVTTAAAGAGSLAGYAGMASAVSTMGLGGATTAIAGLMGSSVTGAAATAVVTAAVGGPMVMGAILISGAGATAYGVYKLSNWAGKQIKTLW